jgi:uncharacterized protein
VTSQQEKFAQQAAAIDAQPAPQPGALKPRRPWRYYVKRGAVLLVAGYLLLCLAIFIFQRRIIYRPARNNNLAVSAWGFGVGQARDISLQAADGTELHGWLISPGGIKDGGIKNAKLVTLFFGAHTGNRGEHVSTLQRLAGHGALTITFDYRGFGDNGGSPSEESIARDARAAWNTLLEKGVKPAAIVLHGDGLGAAVALRLAAELGAENNPPGALIMQGPFYKLDDYLGRALPLLPMRYLISEEYDVRKYIDKLTCPLLVISGTRDPLAPIEYARSMFGVAPATSSFGVPKQMLEFDCTNPELGDVDTETYTGAIESIYHRVDPSKAMPVKRPLEKTIDKKKLHGAPKSTSPARPGK